MNGDWELVTNDMEKTKVLNAFFSLVFTKMRRKLWSKEDLALMEGD